MKIVAPLDTNCDPDVVDYPIPGNDDAIRSIELFCKEMAEAINEGKNILAENNGEVVENAPVSADEVEEVVAEVKEVVAEVKEETVSEEE
jgi:small subunit ribosomal protein S2